MTEPHIIEEIKQFKTQLDGFLSKKYIDPTILLGINNTIQSKFELWMIKDLNDYYQAAEVQQKQVEFTTIKYFETLWSNFHYPIIKFFQHNHGIIYDQLLAEFNKLKEQDMHENKKPKSRNIKNNPEPLNEVHKQSGDNNNNHKHKQDQTNKSKFKLRPVEIRKLNESFLKFIKTINTYYLNFLEYFSTHFKNDLLPNQFLKHFNYTIPNGASPTTNANVQANLLYLLHKVLLCLGDSSRHRGFIETSYLLPSLSLGNFHRFRLLNNEKKLAEFTPYYQSSLIYYKMCIMLLPALNEPYNHIGMIYNLMDNKIDSVYYFLRSNFTRLSSYQLGIKNLTTLLTKDWFKTKLYDTLVVKNVNEFNTRLAKQTLLKSSQLNTIFICLLGYYYLPETYSLNKYYIMKKLRYSKVEFVFLNLNFNEDNFNELMDSDSYPNIDNAAWKEHNLNHYLKQLIILFCVNDLIRNNGFRNFVLKYLEFFLKALGSIRSDSTLKNRLICLRVILTWIKEANFKLNQIHLVKEFINIFNDLLNARLGRSGMELLKSTSRPIRNYYFAEDVLLKDFLLIKYQFKDFKDDHLFDTNDINLLNHDYSSFTVNGIPTFLDGPQDNLSANEIDKEVDKYENSLRVDSVLVLGKKVLLDTKFDIQVDDRFILMLMPEKPQRNKKVPYSRVQVFAQPERNESPNPKSSNSIKEVIYVDEEEEIEEDTEEPEEEPEEDSDSIIDDIEEFILNHSNKLQSLMKPTTMEIDNSISSSVNLNSSSSNVWNGSGGTLMQPNSSDIIQVPDMTEYNPDPITLPALNTKISKLDSLNVQTPHMVGMYSQGQDSRNQLPYVDPQVPHTPIGPQIPLSHQVPMMQPYQYNPYMFQAGNTSYPHAIPSYSAPSSRVESPSRPFMGHVPVSMPPQGYPGYYPIFSPNQPAQYSQHGPRSTVHQTIPIGVVPPHVSNTTNPQPHTSDSQRQ